MNASDFADNSLTGITTVINGSCSITKTLTNDFTIEGTESFQVVIRTGSSSGPIIATSSVITVGDTSVPIYSITPSTTSANEGSTVIFNIATSGVDNGTVVYYDITGSTGISASDFIRNSLSGSLVISGTFNSGTATTSLTLINDVATEGTETFNMNLRTGSISGSIVRVSPTIIINDTSFPPSLYSFTSFTFTNATAEGTLGPTLANLQSSYSAQSWASNTAYLNLFNSTRGYQIWTVPAGGTYRLTAAGAQGGAGKWTSYYGGLGVIMRSTITLVQGDYLIFLVGQRGGYENAGNGSSGGGGGTFVFKTNLSTPILIAGGGGGGGGNSNPVNGRSALTTNNGDTNSSGSVGGSSGAGGPAYGGGGGGSGLTGNGGTGVDTAAGGLNITSSGGTGGRGGSCTASQTGTRNFNSLGQDQGGFGGGGGGEWCNQGGVGGGGGYSGGAGNSTSNGVGGGGGSYVNAALATLIGTSNGTYNSTGTYTNIGYNGSASVGTIFSNSMGYVLVEKI